MEQRERGPSRNDGADDVVTGDIPVVGGGELAWSRAGDAPRTPWGTQDPYPPEEGYEVDAADDAATVHVPVSPVPPPRDAVPGSARYPETPGDDEPGGGGPGDDGELLYDDDLPDPAPEHVDPRRLLMIVSGVAVVLSLALAGTTAAWLSARGDASDLRGRAASSASEGELREADMRTARDDLAKAEAEIGRLSKQRDDARRDASAANDRIGQARSERDAAVSQRDAAVAEKAEALARADAAERAASGNDDEVARLRKQVEAARRGADTETVTTTVTTTDQVQGPSVTATETVTETVQSPPETVTVTQSAPSSGTGGATTG